MRLILSFLLPLLPISAALGQSTERYVFGFLRTHPERVELPNEEAARMQKEHLDHLGSMAKAGYLIGAGPIGTSKDLRGVLIFKGITVEKARAMASEDPAVKAKLMYPSLEEWTGPAGIGAALAEKLKNAANADFKMTRFGLVVGLKQPGNLPVDEATRRAWRQQALAGKAAMFGDFEASKEFSDIAVWRTTDLNEIRALTAEDPSVKTGAVKPEVLVWMVAEGVIP